VLSCGEVDAGSRRAENRLGLSLLVLYSRGGAEREERFYFLYYTQYMYWV
jgi:hypothetical protein